jgi:iron complex transport system substrate-binding protein
MSRLRFALAAIAVSLSLASLGVASAAPPVQKPLFPVTVRAANGSVTISKRPTQIVSLSPTATETLFAVGAGRQVVAVDALSNYPRRAPRTSMSGYRPNAEAIASYRPDLVVVRSDGGIVAELGKLDIPVLVDPEAGSLPDAYRQIRQLGHATGFPKKAAALVARMRSQIGSAARSVDGKGRRLSFYHELTTNYYSATSKTFIGQIYKLFGLRNIADPAGSAGGVYPQLSGEYIVAANPDLIFLADSKCCGQNLQTVASRPGWANVAAVRRRQVVALDDDIVSRWGPRVVTFVRSVARAVGNARR